MNECLKFIWIVLSAFALMGVISMLPFDKYQATYLDELHRIKVEPQRRIEATIRYIEAIENGVEDISNGILAVPPEKYYSPPEPRIKLAQAPKRKDTVQEEKYQKPLYVRDKHNPNILYKYNE